MSRPTAPHAMPESTDDHPAPCSKSELRAQMKQLLAGFDPAERERASAEAGARLVALDAFRHATVVMLYMPLANEVDVTAVAIRCFELGKTLGVPRVDWTRREMQAVEVTSFDDDVMATDEHGIRTPRAGRLLVPSAIDLIVVPGLAFDTRGSRLGRGGGFYDRFLPRLKRSATMVGVAFDGQIVDRVPRNEHDVRVDVVVTDRRVTRTGRSRSRP